MVGGESIRNRGRCGGGCRDFGRDVFEDVFVEVSDKVVFESSKGGGSGSEACEVWLVYGELAHFAGEEIIRGNQIQHPHNSQQTSLIRKGEGDYLDSLMATLWT